MLKQLGFFLASIMKMQWLAVAIVMFFTFVQIPVKGILQESFQGHINKTKIITNVITSSEQALATEVTFYVEFPVEFCCPVLFLYTDHKQDDLYGFHQNGCFSQNQMNLVRERNVVDKRAFLLNSEADNANCWSDSLSRKVQCSGKVKTSVFYMTRWRIGFGKQCEDQVTELNLNFNITVTWLQQLTCYPLVNQNLINNIFVRGGEDCAEYRSMNYYSPINLFGYSSAERDAFTFISPGIYLKADLCYKLALTVACPMLFPVCNASNLVTQNMPCNEMCEDWLAGCANITGSVLSCRGLGLRTEGQCQHQEVTCKMLPEVENATVVYSVTLTDNGSVSAGSTATFHCAQGYYPVGISQLTCQYSGKWTAQPPTCIEGEIRHGNVHNELKIILSITLPIGLTLIISITIIIVSFCYQDEIRAMVYTTTFVRNFRRWRRKGKLSNCIYDLFIAHSDKDSTWVLKEVVENLQQRYPPGYRLASYHFNFDIGSPIITNIISALYNSRAIMIVLSQNFIDSSYCQFELKNALQRALEDPNFQFIFVLMQDLKNMKNVPKNLKQFMINKHVISHKDTLIWKKIEANLGSSIDAIVDSRNITIKIVPVNTDDLEEYKSFAASF